MEFLEKTNKLLNPEYHLNELLNEACEIINSLENRLAANQDLSEDLALWIQKLYAEIGYMETDEYEEDRAKALKEQGEDPSIGIWADLEC